METRWYPDGGTVSTAEPSRAGKSAIFEFWGGGGGTLQPNLSDLISSEVSDNFYFWGGGGGYFGVKGTLQILNQKVNHWKSLLHHR